jgi:predicted aldo/keto reductase-like oxidoreductase
MKMKKHDNNELPRRSFLKQLGGGILATAAVTSGCSGNKAKEGITYGGSTEILGDMTYRTHPTSGDKVSLLGYGCMRWPQKKVKDADGKEQEVIDQEMVNQLVDHAMAHGVNFYDTSPAYLRGKSEQATGIALKRYPRESYYVSTKLSNFSKATWSREASMKMYHDSMRDLQVDYIDYYLLHSLGNDYRNFEQRYVDNGMLSFLQEERKAGRIRHLGFSFHGNNEGFDRYLKLHDEGVVQWDFTLIQLNYLDWKKSDAEYLYNQLVQRGIAVLIMEPLLGGRLSRLPDHIVRRLKMREPERSVASWAFRFAGTQEGVLTVLSGMTYMEHLQDNLVSFSPLKPLTEDEKEFLYETAELISKYPTIPCNDCKYCMPCPYGIDIPAILLHYNKCVNEGSVPKSRQDENYAKMRREFLVSYDRAVPRLRQADHCVGCDQCVKHCPQNIRIPRELRRIDGFVDQLKQDTL